MSQHGDNILLNADLFKRVKAVYDQQKALDLNQEQKELLKKTYDDFVRGGANLSRDDQEKLREINKKLSLLSLKFGDNVLAETNAFQLVIDRKEDLAGLPEAVVNAAAQTAKEAGQEGKWVFTLQKPSLIPFLQYSEKRGLREKIFEAYINRGDQGNEYDNTENVSEMVSLRAEKAQLLGYKNHASYVLEENMAKNPENVYKLLNQVMENWAAAPEVIKTYAKHYETGEPIPDDMVAKIKNSSHFNQGFVTVEYLAASYLDMDWHTIEKPGKFDVNKFENESMQRIHLIPQIVVRYRSTYFSHIFAGGYSAGYYSYIWAEVLDSDAFEAFKETGNLFDPAMALSFRKNILEKGGTDDPMTLYVNFRGKKPDIEPLLKKRGLE